MNFTFLGEQFEINYTAGWFALALINANLAQCKKRSGLNWLLVSMLLGPLATLVLLFRDGRTEPAPDQTP